MRKLKDPRMQAKDSGRSLSSLLERAMTQGGNPEGDAESRGVFLLAVILRGYITGEDELSAALRGFVDALSKRDDPLRKDITVEQWSVFWPALNTLKHAREDYVNARRESQESLQIVTSPRPGMVGDGAAKGSAENSREGGEA